LEKNEKELGHPVSHILNTTIKKNKRTFISLFFCFERKCVFVFLYVGDWGSRKQQLANREGGRNEKENENNTTMIPFRRWVL